MIFGIWMGVCGCVGLNMFVSMGYDLTHDHRGPRLLAFVCAPAYISRHRRGIYSSRSY